MIVPVLTWGQSISRIRCQGTPHAVDVGDVIKARAIVGTAETLKNSLRPTTRKLCEDVKRDTGGQSHQNRRQVALTEYLNKVSYRS
jgi:hypothetical protein